jgi:hypothetical protein
MAGAYVSSIVDETESSLCSFPEVQSIVATVHSESYRTSGVALSYRVLRSTSAFWLLAWQVHHLQHHQQVLKLYPTQIPFPCLVASSYKSVVRPSFYFRPPSVFQLAARALDHKHYKVCQHTKTLPTTITMIDLAVHLTPPKQGSKAAEMSPTKFLVSPESLARIKRKASLPDITPDQAKRLRLEPLVSTLSVAGLSFPYNPYMKRQRIDLLVHSVVVLTS